VTSALLQGSGDAELGLFEVDEAALPEIARRAPPRSLLLANLFRDQLDRYGELRLLQRRWRETVDALPAATRLLVGADDPAVADLGAGRPGVVTFGFDDPRHALPVMDHAADSAFCVRCGTATRTPRSTSATSATTAVRAAAWRDPALDFAARDVPARRSRAHAASASTRRTALPR
jgi:UDP-N-acetylmuramyl tripeptide synthase